MVTLDPALGDVVTVARSELAFDFVAIVPMGKIVAELELVRFLVAVEAEEEQWAVAEAGMELELALVVECTEVAELAMSENVVLYVEEN